MRCLFCLHGDTLIYDSRNAFEGLAMRRRRKCVQCGGRFITYEVALPHLPASRQSRSSVEQYLTILQQILSVLQ